MKVYEEFVKEFETEREYERKDVKEILDSFKRYHDTINAFIGQSERIFLIAGEICGYNAEDVCKKCDEARRVQKHG